MMRTVYIPFSQLDFIAARHTLNQIGYTPRSTAEKLAWRIIDPFSNIDKKIDSISLTDKMDFDNQIRFFLCERVERMLSNIAVQVKKYASSLEVRHTGDIDVGSQLFFKLLEKHISITFTLTRIGHSALLHTVQPLCSQEQAIEELLSDRDSCQTPETPLAFARRYLNVGNGWTAEKILRKLAKQHQSLQITQLLSFALNMQGKADEAEGLYLDWLSSKKPEDKVRAAYVLSMLYARHHRSEKQSHQKSKAYLTLAFEILNNHTKDTYQDHLFDRVFNRNGYALVLFREGNFLEAEKLLKWGIQQMHKHAAPKEQMHLSVLYFNIAQIYEKLNQWDSCLEAMDNLIKIDPFFAEYHAEKARFLIKGNSDFVGSSKEVMTALELDPNVYDADALYAILYEFSENENYDEVIGILRHAEQLGVTIDDNLRILNIEAFLNTGRVGEASAVAQKLSLPNDALSIIQQAKVRSHETLSSTI